MERAKLFTTGLALSLLVGITSPVPAKATPPASVWTAVERSAHFSSVIYDAERERFLAADRDGLLYASSNGLDWSEFSENSLNANAITYCMGKYVTVSSVANEVYDPFAYVETDGNSNSRSTSYNLASGLRQDWQSVTCASFNSIPTAVAVANTGVGNRVATSTDGGVTWVSKTSAADKNWKSVTSGIDVAVAVASEPTTDSVMISYNGSEWVPQTAAAALNWTSVTYGKGLFVAVASNGTDKQVMTSPDGGTWTLRSTPSTQSWTSVTYGKNGYFVAVANSGGPSNNVMISRDGINWTTQTSIGNQAWSSIAFGDGRFVAVSSGNETDSIMATSSTSIACGDGVFYEIDALGTAFDGNDCTTNLVLNDSVSGIAPNAFEYSTFTSVTIPSSVEYIGDNAFDGDPSALATVTFAPNSQLESIGKMAFGTRLESIEIPRNVTTIGEKAFRYTSALTSVTFETNSQLISIGEQAFANSSLTSITIPDSVTSIGEEAFASASSLTSLIIPESVTTIGNFAFESAESLSNFYFLGNAPDSVGVDAFNDVGELATAYIQPNAEGFETFEDSAIWNGLIVDAAGFTTLPLYRNWQTPLAAITNGGPKVGDRVFASAFERELSRNLFRPGYRENTDDNQTITTDYPSPEEYVYRITKQPNERASSVDHQSSAGYESLDTEAQASWYGELGFTLENPYQFTWKAFMCVNQAEDQITKPTGLSLSYASREDGVMRGGGFNAAHSTMFKNAAIDWHQSAHLQGLRTVVGKYWGNGDLTSRNFLGDSDPIYNTHVWGFLDVNGSCGAGSLLQVLTLMDSADPETASAITTKSFVIPEQLNLDYFGIKFQISSVGTTLGVTGAGGPSRRDFNAALWGLTTIAETSEAPPAPPAPPIRREPTPTPTPEPTPTPTPTPTPAPAATTNLQPSTEMLKVGTVYMSTGSYFLNNATKKSLRKFAREVKASDKKVVLVYGYTDNRRGVNNTWLSRQRAKAVANYIRPMLKGKKIVIGWYASGKPVSTGTSAADLALNRRVEIYTK